MSGALVVAVEEGGRAAQPVGAALQRQVHRPGPGVSELRVVGRGFDLELLDRVRWRLDADPAPRHVARPVDGELAVDRAAHREAAPVVVVHRPLQLVGPLERGAGDEAREAVGGAVAKGDLGDQLAVDHLAHGGAAAFEDRTIGDHLDLFDHAARFERDVVLDLVTDAHQDVVVDPGAEAVERRRHSIGARKQVQHRVAS